MNSHTTPPQIEELNNYLERYAHVIDVPFNSYLIIWQHDEDTRQENNSSIYCLQYHQMQELPVLYKAKGTVISFSKNLMEMINGYTLPLFEKKLFSFYKPVALTVDADKQNSLRSILKTLRHELGVEVITESHSEIVRVLLKLFLLRLADCDNTIGMADNNKEEELLAKKYLDLVHVHYVEWKRVSDYAAMLCVTPNYLNSKIKKITGHTASYHIQQRIILEAKRQARWQGLCMKEVAYYLGFADLSHFSKFFKNATGINFSAYLKTDGMY